MIAAKQNSTRKKGKRKEKQRKGKNTESRKEERSVVYRVPDQSRTQRPWRKVSKKTHMIRKK